MDFKQKLNAMVHSRRFWMAVGGVAVIVADAFGLPLTDEQVVGLTVTVGAWIVGDSLRKTE